MKRLLSFALLAAMLLSASSALALSGQNYDTFTTYYQDDVTFINDNDNRHLLPMVASKRNSDAGDGRVYYEIVSDVLSVTVTTNLYGVIENTLIILTAPAGMEYGNSTYNDFAISGYHSYAFLMAMDTNAEARSRYALVEDVVAGMRDNDGAYTRQIGVYTLTAQRVDQSAVIEFVNNGVPTDAPSTSPDATVDPSDIDPNAPSDSTDDAANVG